MRSKDEQHQEIEWSKTWNDQKPKRKNHMAELPQRNWKLIRKNGWTLYTKKVEIYTLHGYKALKGHLKFHLQNSC